MNEAQGPTRNATRAATSSGRPRRGAHWRLIWSSGRTRCRAGRAFSASTWMAPGRPPSVRPDSRTPSASAPAPSLPPVASSGTRPRYCPRRGHLSPLRLHWHGHVDRPSPRPLGRPPHQRAPLQPRTRCPGGGPKCVPRQSPLFLRIVGQVVVGRPRSSSPADAAEGPTSPFRRQLGISQPRIRC